MFWTGVCASLNTEKRVRKVQSRAFDICSVCHRHKTESFASGKKKVTHVCSSPCVSFVFKFNSFFRIIQPESNSKYVKEFTRGLSNQIPPPTRQRESRVQRHDVRKSYSI